MPFCALFKSRNSDARSISATDSEGSNTRRAWTHGFDGLGHFRELLHIVPRHCWLISSMIWSTVLPRVSGMRYMTKKKKPTSTAAKGRKQKPPSAVDI